MAKAIRETVERRIEEVLRLRLAGAGFPAIRAHVRALEAVAGSAWELPPGAKPLSGSQIRRYSARAARLIAPSSRERRRKAIYRTLARMRHLYAKAVRQGELRTALAVLNSEARLLDLFPPKKVAPTRPDGKRPYNPLEELSDEELERQIAETNERIAALGTGDAAPSGQ